MVDLSVFYIIINFFQTFIDDYVVVNIETIVFSLLGLLVVTSILAMVMPKKKEEKGGSARRVFTFLARFLLVLLVAFALAYIWPIIVAWEVKTFGLSGVAFSAWSVGTLIALIAIGMYVASRGFSKEPNNKSLLNARQKFTWLSYGLVGFLAFFVLYNVNYELFRYVLLVIFFLTEMVSIVFWFYDPFIYILSQLMRRKKKTPFKPTPDKLNRYAVIGCAHNEQGVIGQLIESLYATTYPKTKYDVYVICDNCTDNTAGAVQIGRAHV